jgi:cystathionine gamma-lyase
MSSFNTSDWKWGTRAIHVGSEPDVNGAVVPPISLSTTFAQSELGGAKEGASHPSSYGDGFEYSRSANPTRGCFERQVAACESAKWGLAYASGLAATTGIMQTLKSGDHVLCIDDVYGGTQRLFRQFFAPEISFTFIDMNNVDQVIGAIQDNTKMIWIESPTNPTLKVTNISEVSKRAHERNKDIVVVVDNTFMSPYLQNPLVLGADVVMHSVTKYIGGHSDVVMGCVCVNSDTLHQRLRWLQNACGSVPAPFDCYMALRGLKTLHVRMEAAQANALKIASFLEEHPAVEKVHYPGLKSHPQHLLVQKQCRGPGAMVSFVLRAGLVGSQVFLKNVKVFTLAESLGAVESLAECPAIMTHNSVPPEQRAKLGISDGLIRLSCGIEHVDDLLADLKAAIATIGAK